MSVPVLKPFEKWKNLFKSGKLRKAMEQAREAWATTTNETKCSEVRRPSGSELRNSRPGAQIIIFNEVIMKILILSDLHAHNDVLDKMDDVFAKSDAVLFAGDFAACFKPKYLSVQEIIVKFAEIEKTLWTNYFMAATSLSNIPTYVSSPKPTQHEEYIFPRWGHYRERPVLCM